MKKGADSITLLNISPMYYFCLGQKWNLWHGAPQESKEVGVHLFRLGCEIEVECGPGFGLPACQFMCLKNYWNNRMSGLI